MKRLMTVDIDTRLREVAELKARTPSFKELARETGLAPSYLRKLVSEKVQSIHEECSTNPDARCQSERIP